MIFQVLHHTWILGGRHHVLSRTRAGCTRRRGQSGTGRFFAHLLAEEGETSCRNAQVRTTAGNLARLCQGWVRVLQHHRGCHRSPTHISQMPTSRRGLGCRGFFPSVCPQFLPATCRRWNGSWKRYMLRFIHELVDPCSPLHIEGFLRVDVGCNDRPLVLVG